MLLRPRPGFYVLRLRRALSSRADLSALLNGDAAAGHRQRAESGRVVPALGPPAARADRRQAHCARPGVGSYSRSARRNYACRRGPLRRWARGYRPFDANQHHRSRTGQTR